MLQQEMENYNSADVICLQVSDVIPKSSHLLTQSGM
jgi:hypothetical protein